MSHRNRNTLIWGITILVGYGGASATTHAQAPGVDPRGVALHSPLVIIASVEERWETVIRPDKITTTSRAKRQPDGTYSLELPRSPLDYLVGHIFHVRIDEILKTDSHVRPNQVVAIYAPFKLEGGVSLLTKGRFLLALRAYHPKRDEFRKTSVVTGQNLNGRHRAFDVEAQYYVVSADANGVVGVTDKNRQLVDDIRTAICIRSPQP